MALTVFLDYRLVGTPDGQLLKDNLEAAGHLVHVDTGNGLPEFNEMINSSEVFILGDALNNNLLSLMTGFAFASGVPVVFYLPSYSVGVFVLPEFYRQFDYQICNTIGEVFYYLTTVEKDLEQEDELPPDTVSKPAASLEKNDVVIVGDRMLVPVSEREVEKLLHTMKLKDSEFKVYAYPETCRYYMSDWDMNHPSGIRVVCTANQGKLDVTLLDDKGKPYVDKIPAHVWRDIVEFVRFPIASGYRTPVQSATPAVTPDVKDAVLLGVPAAGRVDTVLEPIPRAFHAEKKQQKSVIELLLAPKMIEEILAAKKRYEVLGFLMETCYLREAQRIRITSGTREGYSAKTDVRLVNTVNEASAWIMDELNRMGMFKS